MPDSHNETESSRTRRTVSYAAALYALVIWPNALLVYFILFDLPESLIDKMLIYMGTLAVGPVGVFLWNSIKKRISGHDL